MNRWTMRLTGAIAMSAALVGCGQAATTTPKKSPSSTTAQEVVSLHNELPASIKSQGYLTMATDATVGAPFASFAANNKTIVGLDIDLAQAIGKTLGVKVHVVNTPFDTFIPGLQAGRYDFSVSVMLDTHAREKVVTFVDFIKDGSGFLVKKGSQYSNLTLAKLCGLKVGALDGSVEANDLATQSTKCQAEGKPAIQIGLYQLNSSAVLAVASGRIVAFDGDSDVNAYIQTQKAGAVEQSGPAYGVAIDGIAILKGSSLIQPIDGAMKHLLATGVYHSVLAKYGLASGALSSITINHALL